MNIRPKHNIYVKYAPRFWARETLHRIGRKAIRFIVLVIHRRGGKTTGAINHLIKDCVTHKRHRYAYVGPTYKQAKRIAWSVIVKRYTRTLPGIRYNEQELTVFFPNGSELILVGADNPDSLRGIGLNGAILDEYPLMSPIVFTEIITKCVADTLGYIIVLGTPKGKNHFYRLFESAKKHAGKWLAVFRTIDDSLKKEKGKVIRNLKSALADDLEMLSQGLLTQAQIDQEWYCSFEASVKGAVYGDQIALARKNKRIGTVPYDPAALVHTVWDLGVSKSDAMSIGFYQKIGKEMRKIDYYENTGLGLAHYIKIVKAKPYKYGKHFAPHDIKHKELTTGKTRQDTAGKMGLDFEVVPSLSIDDGIDLARAMWSRLWIDETNCAMFLDLIGSYVYEWDDKRGVFRPKPVHDFTSHAADELRYAAIVEDEMTNERQKDEEDDEPEEEDDDEFKGTVEIRKKKVSKDLPTTDELAHM